MAKTTELFMITEPEDWGGVPYPNSAAIYARDCKVEFAKGRGVAWAELLREGWRCRRFLCSPIIKEQGEE